MPACVEQEVMGKRSVPLDTLQMITNVLDNRLPFITWQNDKFQV